MKYRVSRDPVYGEVLLSPLEILCIDSRPVQRLREISQLGGAERVYPGATHTRFLHSLGVMHLSGMYAEHLKFENGKSRLLRLAGLLHDIGHGPYSHQFDEVAYRRAGLKDGHDEQRERLLLELMPPEMMRVYDTAMKEEWRKNIIEDIKVILGEEVVELSLQEAFFAVMKRVCDIYEGEHAGTADFNIVQGPLGADRIDFVLRDSHYCGTPEYGTLDLQRIVRSSKIIKQGNIERLTYNEKIMDSIYRVLFGRFMMYKNVYFHKTARAADLMIQRVLELSYDFLDIGSYIEDVSKFNELTEGWLYYSIREKYNNLSEYDEKTASEIKEAYEIMQNYKERKLWKSIVEMSFSITGMDPTRVAMSVGEERIEAIVSGIKKVLDKAEIKDADRKELEKICDNSELYFKIDTPYKLTLAHPAEFLVNEVYLRTGRADSELVDFETFLKNNAFYQSVSGQLVQIVRIYIMSDVRDLLDRYDLLDFKDGLELTTRW